MNLIEFKNKWLGKKVDFDGAYGNQCVDFARQYAVEVLKENFKPKGNAKDLWFQDWGLDWEKIENKISTTPKPGDIVIWKGPSQYGHIAVVTKANLLSFTVLEQNAGNGNGNGLGDNAIREKVYYYKDVLGFIRHTNMFGNEITFKGFTFPSSIYGYPVRLGYTSQENLMGMAYIKGYTPGATKDMIYIFPNTFKKGYLYVLKVIIHEFTHIVQHKGATDAQEEFLVGLSEYATANKYYVSEYATKMPAEDIAETYAYGKVYTDNQYNELPSSKQWNKEIQFKYENYKKIIEYIIAKIVNKK